MVVSKPRGGVPGCHIDITLTKNYEGQLDSQGHSCTHAEGEGHQHSSYISSLSSLRAISATTQKTIKFTVIIAHSFLKKVSYFEGNAGLSLKRTLSVKTLAYRTLAGTITMGPASVFIVSMSHLLLKRLGTVNIYTDVMFVVVNKWARKQLDWFYLQVQIGSTELRQ